MSDRSSRYRWVSRIGAVFVVLFVVVVDVWHVYDDRSAATTRKVAASSTTTTRATTTTTDPDDGDIFDDAAVGSYLSTEAQGSSEITAAVYDAVTGQTWVYKPAVTLTTASVIKVDILEALLARVQTEHVALTLTQQSLAESMIEESTDDAATDLWNTVGGSAALERYNDEVGLTRTKLNTTGYWGLSTTSALDQVRLVEKVAFTNATLSASSRDYELDLMRNVTADQDWGISAGLPSGVSVALKNGWDPITGVWEINSEGWVDGDGQSYVISVMCWGSTTETAGISAIDGLSSAIWTALSGS